jgi:hypothetical protein
MHREVFFAYPAPFMLAHLAYHVGTPTIFFNSNAASLAHSNLLLRSGPHLIFLFEFSIAGFWSMRWKQTSKASFLVTYITLNYLLF